VSAEPPPPLAATPPLPAVSVTAGEDRRPSALATLAGLYSEPSQTFRDLARRPSFVVPLVLAILVNVIFTFVWLKKADAVELSRNQMQEAGVFDRIPVEQHEAVVQRQAHLLPVVAWLGPLVFGPVLFFGLAAAWLFVFRFFYEAETTFVQSLAVVWWSFLAVALVTTPITLLVMSLRGEWSVDPRSVVEANLGALVDKQAVPKPLHALLDSLDLFSAWTLFLLSAGYAATAKRPLASAAFGVVGLWAVYVLLKMGLALIF